MTFATWLTGSLVLVATLLSLLLVSYLNCERLPARPGWYSRRVIRRRPERQRRAESWLNSHPRPETGERESRHFQRRRRLAELQLWRGQDAVLADSSNLGGCLENATRQVAQDRDPKERTTKELRFMPFEEPEQWPFTVRLNQIIDLEYSCIAYELHGGLEWPSAATRLDRSAPPGQVTELKTTGPSADLASPTAPPPDTEPDAAM